MSFFGDLFSQKITYAEYVRRDKNYPELIHVFGARRVMPDEGDSFDIWHHRIIDTNDFSVIKGIKQNGNDFSIKSAFAKRALEDMAKKLNRNLAFDLLEGEEDEDETAISEDPDDFDEEEEYEEDEEIEEDPVETEPSKKNTFPVILHDSRDTDTAELPKMPRDGIVLTTIKDSDQERFTIRVFRYGQEVASHRMKGMCDYFRNEIHYPKKNMLLMTYRKEIGLSSGGMGFYVLNTESGELLHDGFIA